MRKKESKLERLKRLWGKPSGDTLIADCWGLGANQLTFGILQYCLEDNVEDQQKLIFPFIRRGIDEGFPALLDEFVLRFDNVWKAFGFFAARKSWGKKERLLVITVKDELFPLYLQIYGCMLNPNWLHRKLGPEKCNEYLDKLATCMCHIFSGFDMIFYDQNAYELDVLMPESLKVIHECARQLEAVGRTNTLTNNLDIGEPFYKPSYFKQWNIGDELLRRNSHDGSEYLKGKVRRQHQMPKSGKGKRPTYKYSEPDIKKCWPEKFTKVEILSIKINDKAN